MFGVAGLLLMGRLFQIQIMQHQSFAVQAQLQYGLAKEVPAARGTIRSADGFDLASTQPAYLVAANPQVIEKPAEVAAKLMAILAAPTPTPTKTVAQASLSAKQVDPSKEVAELTGLLSNKARQYVAIAHKVDAEHKQQIEQLHIKGVSFFSEEKRYYQECELASQVLGFVGSDGDGKDAGYYGIEGYFDRELRGQDGVIDLQKDPAGNPIPVGTYTAKPAEQGATITLTINRGIQYMLEQKLKTGIDKNSATSGSVILMEPNTGRILAMANFPTYNPSQWQDTVVQKDELYKNRAIQDSYEPGSVMKSFTVATGLELGTFKPDSTYTSAPYKVDDHTITTADHKYYGTATVTQMLEHSDNTGAAQFGTKIGRDNFLTWFHKIGLDQPTGVTLEGEAKGLVPARKDWLPITLATASFGQGVSVTPMQLLEMMATIANDGVQMKPTIIQSMAQGGQTVEVKPETVGRIYSDKTSQQMTSMLQDVVAKGEFHRLALQDYHIAGKTSTAQIPLSTGGYDPDNVITTFVGYAPATDPKFIMLVKLDKPAIHNSALTVVPVWMDMAIDLFRYYGIAPEKAEPTPTPVATPLPTYIP
jgi:cell division protein FtsI/penicillin-binding protein 2